MKKLYPGRDAASYSKGYSIPAISSYLNFPLSWQDAFNHSNILRFLVRSNEILTEDVQRIRVLKIP